MGSNRQPDDLVPLSPTPTESALADAIVGIWREERAMNPHLVGTARGETLLDARLRELIADALAATRVRHAEAATQHAAGHDAVHEDRETLAGAGED